METSTFSKSQKSLHLVLRWGHGLYPHSTLAAFPYSWAPLSLFLSLAFGLMVTYLLLPFTLPPTPLCLDSSRNWQ